MRILVMGASGLVGNCVKDVLSKQYADVYGTYCTHQKPYAGDSHMLHFDLALDRNTDSLLHQLHPDIIISSLRGDFERQTQAHRRMAAYGQKNPSAKLIYISSLNVAVFSERKEIPEKLHMTVRDVMAYISRQTAEEGTT